MSRTGRNVPNSKSESTRYMPAINPEDRENQLISLAVDQAERDLRKGCASSQIVSHYLKLAATKEKTRIELEILQKQKELIEAKTESYKSAKATEELYAEAIKAMREYGGHDSDDIEDVY